MELDDLIANLKAMREQYGSGKLHVVIDGKTPILCQNIGRVYATDRVEGGPFVILETAKETRGIVHEHPRI